MSRKAYEVRMSDAVENTGLDCQRFASKGEAEVAAACVNDEYPNAHAQVIETEGHPTITLDEWSNQPWR